MCDVFISYAKEDRDKVGTIAKALKQQGWDVFWDPVIPPGRTWRDVLKAQLESARCVVVAWSEKSIESRWVLEEAEDANGRGLLVPIRIEDVLPPLGFRAIQAADLTDWSSGEPDQKGMLQLVEALTEIGHLKARLDTKRGTKEEVARQGQEDQRKRPPEETKRGKGASPWTIAAAVAALLIAGASPWWWSEILHDGKGARDNSPMNREAPVKQVPGGQIQVGFSIMPKLIQDGGKAEISIVASDKQHTRIAGANVRIKSGGGWFASSGTTTEVGRTDSRGVFVAQWQAPKTAAKGYPISVTVVKDGFTDNTLEFTLPIATIQIIPLSPVHGGQIQVRCTASPHSIPAGGMVGISILAFNEQNSPIAGANVRIESGGGWFASSGTTTEVGQTDSRGVFVTRWKAPKPAAGGYGMSVNVNKDGYKGGACNLTVPIQ